MGQKRKKVNLIEFNINLNNNNFLKYFQFTFIIIFIITFKYANVYFFFYMGIPSLKRRRDDALDLGQNKILEGSIII